jgi:hypothetical protein
MKIFDSCVHMGDAGANWNFSTFKSEIPGSYVGTGSLGVLMDFYCRRVEPHEDQFVFFRRRKLLNLDTNSNSAHKGTNKGMKYHSLPVKPTHSLVELTKILTHQSKLKSGDGKIRASQYDRNHSRWSSLQTADYLTRLGESLLCTQWGASQNYVDKTMQKPMACNDGS